jgi:outer membrane protein TolC
MNSLKQILLLILFFWAISIFAQQEHKESQNTVDYRSIEESLRKVDGKLTDLLKRIEIHNKRKKVHQSNDYKQTLEKKEIHLPTLPEKRNISLDEVKQDFKKVEAKIGGFSNRKNTNLTERKKYDSYLKESKSNKLIPIKGIGWDLFILREIALKHSPDILLKKAELRMDKKDIPVIRYGKLPTVKAKVTFDDYEKISQFETYSEPDPYNTFSYGIEGRWVLYDGHKITKQIDIAENEISRAQWSVNIEEQRVLKSLNNLYFQALSAQTQVLFLPKIEKISKEKVTVYSHKLKSGIVDRMLLNDSIRELESIRAQVLNSVHSLEMVKSELAFLLNVEDSFWDELNEFTVPEDFELKYNFNPATSSSANFGQSGVDIAKSKYEEIKTGNSPVIELIGSAGHRSRNRVTFNNQGQELTFGLSVTLPITEYYLTRKKLDHAREEIKKSELEKVRMITRQKNEFSSEMLKLRQNERSLAFQLEMLKLQKKRLKDIISGSTRGIFDKSNILMEEEKLLKREMYVELTRINYIKQKYQLDLMN